jgi:hypothetical protein
MSNKSGNKDKWQDNPMATTDVKQNVANRDCSNKRGIEPEKHPNVISRPKILCDPFNKTAIEQSFVKDVNDIRRKKLPKENA